MRPVARGRCFRLAGRGSRLLAATVLALLAGATGAPSASAAAGDIFTAAGDGTFTSSGDGGPATSAGTGGVEGVFFSPGGFHLIERAIPKVRYVDAGGTISTTAGGGAANPGDGGPAIAAFLQDPEQVIRDRDGNVYFTEGNRVRRVSALGIISTVAGTGAAGYSGDGGPATAAQLSRPHGLAFDLDGNLYVGDCDNFRVRRVAPLGVISTVAGIGTRGYAGDGGAATAAMLDCPVDVAIDFAGRLLIADNGNNVVRRVDTGGDITTIAGTGAAGYSGDGGPATAALMRQPQGLDVDGAGSVYIAEAANHVIRKVDAGGAISTVAGTGAAPGFSGDAGPATLAQLNGPREVSFDPANGDFYIADRSNNRVRRVEALGVPSPPPSAIIDAGPASPGNDSTPTWSFSISPAQDVRYECRLERGAAVISDWTVCASPATYDLSAEPDGSYSFSVRAVSLSGAGTPASGAYELDRGAPGAPTIDSMPTSPSTSTTPSWGFSGDSGATFECRLTSLAGVVSDWAACSSPRSYDLAAQPDGSYTFSVRQTDAAGNTSAEANAWYTLDTTAPAPPGIDSAPTSPGSDPLPSWSFSSEAGAVLECRLTRGAATISDWASCSSPRSYDLSAQPDGIYTFSARAADSAGNAGAPAAVDYELDRVAPGAPALTATPGALGNDPTPTWSFTSDSGTSSECRLERGVTVVSGWQACPGAATYDLGAEPDGGYRFLARSRDPAGSLSPETTSDHELDRVAPAAPSIDSGPGAVGSGRTPSWAFSEEPSVVYECRLTRGATVVDDWTPCASPAAYDLTGEPDGIFTFEVRGRDAAQNTGSASASDYRLDTVGEDTAIESGPGPVGNDASPSWAFAGEAGASYDCMLERGAAVVYGWAPCTSPQSFDVAPEPDGIFTFRVRSRDEAGNVGAPASYDYELDRVAPGVPRFTGSPGALGNDTTPRWAFTSDAGALAECSLTSRGGAPGPWEACADERSYDLAVAGDGTYALAVRATDSAGNTGPLASSAYVLDATAPDPPTITDDPGASGRAHRVSWAFTGELTATFECRLALGSLILDGWAPCASRARFVLQGGETGKHTFRVRSRDQAGNLGPSTRSDYDLLAPRERPEPDPDEPPKNGDGPSTGGAPAPGGPVTLGPQTPAVGATPAGGSAGRPSSSGGASTPRDAEGDHRKEREPDPSGGGIPSDRNTPGGGPGPNGASDDGESLSDRLFGALGIAALWVGRNLHKTGFPLLLVFLVVGYLAVQNRLDRRDPKLALAPVHADRDLEFLPPPRPGGAPLRSLTP